MDSWWQFGEHYGTLGSELALYSIECPFCNEKGNWALTHREQKKKPNGSKILYFDTYKCGSCASFIMVFWSGCHQIHNFRTLPWPIKFTKYPDYLPESVGRYWLQAHRNLTDQNWDAAAVMARSALQVALRDKGAKGKSLREEIKELAEKGELPPLMRDWSDNVRLLGNDSAHPELDSEGASSQDASDVTHFLDFLLEYLYQLPKKIEEYRSRE